MNSVAFVKNAISTLQTARCALACRVVWQGSLTISRGAYADQGVRPAPWKIKHSEY